MPGFGRFVKTQTASGKAGGAVKILGTDRPDATPASALINGTAAAFTVVSKSEIATTVPADATRGEVKLASNAERNAVKVTCPSAC